MADQPTTPSGSRWEPGPDESPADAPQAAESAAGGAGSETSVPPYPDPYGEPALDQTALDQTGDASEERRAVLRRRGGLAGAAAAIALGAGLTGFVVGHATAGDDRNGFSPAGFTGQVPGDGQLGGGQQLPPGLGGRDGGHDWDHDQNGDQNGGGGPFGQQAPGSDGSSGSSGSGTTSGGGTTGNRT